MPFVIFSFLFFSQPPCLSYINYTKRRSALQATALQKRSAPPPHAWCCNFNILFSLTSARSWDASRSELAPMGTSVISVRVANPLLKISASVMDLEEHNQCASIQCLPAEIEQLRDFEQWSSYSLFQFDYVVKPFRLTSVVSIINSFAPVAATAKQA